MCHDYPAGTINRRAGGECISLDVVVVVAELFNEEESF